MIELATIEVRAATDQVTGSYTEKKSRTATKLDLSLKRDTTICQKISGIHLFDLSQINLLINNDNH